MCQPPGFVDPQFPNHVCHLKKALYGLKQAQRAWYHRLAYFLRQVGFTSSKADTSLFIKRINDFIIYVLIYVDDIIITRSSGTAVLQLVKTL